MKKLLLALGLFMGLALTALADPITLNISQTPRGFTWPGDANPPCSRNLNCRPVGSAQLDIFDANNQPLGTIAANGATTTLALDFGQTAIVNLGSFTLTGSALSALPVDYRFFVGFAVAGSVNGWTMTSLLFLDNGALAIRTFSAVMGVPPIVTFANGERFQFGGVTTSNGNLAVSITRLTGAAQVPEPTTLFLLGSGLAGLAGLTRRNRKRTAS